jgi:hypothetical protein
MRRSALVLVMCTGCDVVFGLQHIETPPTDATSDVNGDAGMPGPCSAITMLADNFAIDRFHELWPSSLPLDGTTITVQNGEAVLDLANPDEYVSLDSARYYDLREGQFSLRLRTDATFYAGDSITLDVASERAGNHAGVTVLSGQVQFVVYLASGAINTISNQPYDLAANPYLRLRHPGAQLVLEGSPDGVAYTQIGVSEDGIDFTSVHTTLQAHRGAGSPAVNVYVGDVNGGTPRGAACPIASLHDDFSTTMLGEQWARSYASPNSLKVGGGVLQMIANGPGSFTAFIPSTVHDLRDGAVVFEVTRMIDTSTSGEFDLAIGTTIGDQIAYRISAAHLVGTAMHRGAATMPFNTPYDPTTMRWMRIAAGPTEMTWDTSADGTSWQTHGEMALLDGLDRVDFAIGINIGTVDETDLDNFDLPP